MDVGFSAYWEDFYPHQVFISPARTVTESDILRFAGIGGNFHQLHTDEEYCRQTIFGRRIAHGLLVLAILEGMLERMGLIRRIVAYLGAKEIRFRRPVYIGDTIYGRFEVANLYPWKDGQAGVVEIIFQGINQRKEVVCTGIHIFLIARRKG